MKFTEAQLEQAFISLLEDQGYPYVPGWETVREPEIIEKDGGVQVTLFKSEGSTMGGTMGGTIVRLTNRQLEVLELINVNNKISIREIAKKLHINVSATQAHLDALKEKGILSREGGTRGFWKILIDN